jgi:hypothetical protein
MGSSKAHHVTLKQLDRLRFSTIFNGWV